MNSRVGKGLHKTGTLNFATNAVRKLSNFLNSVMKSDKERKIVHICLQSTLAYNTLKVRLRFYIAACEHRNVHTLLMCGRFSTL